MCLYYQDSKFREKLGRSRRGSFVQFSSDDGQFDLEAHKLQPRVQNSSFLNAIDENIRSYPKSLFSLSVNGLVQCFSAEYKIRAKKKKKKHYEVSMRYPRPIVTPSVSYKISVSVVMEYGRKGKV